MARSTTLTSTAHTAIYSTTNARNLGTRVITRAQRHQSTKASCFPRIIPRRVLDFAHISRPLYSSISKFSLHRFITESKHFHCSNISTVSHKSSLARAAGDQLSIDEAKMTVKATPWPCLTHDGNLSINGNVVLRGVPQNVAVSEAPSSSGVFVGATASVASSRHVFSLGVLEEYRFMCLFRHKIWWMIPRFGSVGSDIPMETQMLLLEVKDDSSDNTFYVLFLPVLEGRFRATLQGNLGNELEFCVESGDAYVKTTQVTESVYINSGDNPFKLIKDSFKILQKHKGTFNLLEHKNKPAHLDWFGWCTWDAFYKDVNPVGIKQGIDSLTEGGFPPKFLIIDDGWQSTFNEFQNEDEPFVEGTQFASRLADLKESSEFMSSGVNLSCRDLKDFIKLIKENHSVKFVYVWHALVGYWGGLLTSSDKTKRYDPKLMHPIQSPGNVGNLRDAAMDSIEKYGVGLIDPEKVHDFFDDLHSYLSKCGVDGVKVDVQNLIETLGSGHGGRVDITRGYQTALEESVEANFKGNNLICCMSHNNDSIYSSRKSATARASEDFMPREPTFQTLHVASVAFNSLFLGQVVVPDWDMFQSDHYTAEFHGAARALGGCPVYVSDKPGKHDFKILKKLVLPDGTILRAKYAGRPTRDCLFVDTVMDRKSLLKIWNLNKFSGVVGVFNCQGAGSWPLREGPKTEPSDSFVLSGRVRPRDVEFLEEAACESWDGGCIIYAFHSGSITRLSKEGSLEVSLNTLECEVFTVSPVRVVDNSLLFAPIGLIDMYNSGGSTESLSFVSEHSGSIVRIEARGRGRYGAYSSKKPISCTLDGEKQEFEYNAENGLLIVKLEEESECKTRGIIDICY